MSGVARLFFTGLVLWSLAPVLASSNDLTDDVLASIEKTYESIFDYQCRLETLSILGDKREERHINFYFKKPKLIRMDVLKGNRPFDSGSVGVYEGGDKVTGHRGGALKGIILNLPKESALATTIRGVTFDESDLETVLRNLYFYRDNAEIVASETHDAYFFTCITDHPEENDNISKDLVWIDKKSLLITGNERYEGETLVQAVKWKGFIINAGLPIELFDVRFDVQELEKRGIPILNQEVE
jgi:outer membrane lipoprotein-sorting protein